jgi:hypothetical protein
MNNNYKIIRTIYENAFQRILECKDDDTGAIFYSNIITSKKVINLINLNDLKKIKSNILECYNTEDRIYIFTTCITFKQLPASPFISSTPFFINFSLVFCLVTHTKTQLGIIYLLKLAGICGN